MALDLLLSPWTLLLLLLYLGQSLYHRLTRRRTAFDELPWAGLPAGWFFPKLRAQFTMRSKRKELEDAWRRVRPSILHDSDERASRRLTERAPR